MFLNFFSFYQVVRPLGRKSVNKYLYDPSEPKIQTASRSVQPFLQGSLCDRHKDHTTRSVR